MSNRLFLLLVSIIVLLLIFLLFSSLKLKYVNESSSPTSFKGEIFKRQAPIRRRAFRNILESNETDHLTFYNALVPELFCSNKVRLGTVGDGGKWICSPHRLPTNCVVLSLGINNMISFDEEIQEVSEKRCRLLAFDSFAQSKSTMDRLKTLNGNFVKAMIGNGRGGTETLSDLLKRQQIDKVEILKMDIEGYEFDTIIPFVEEFRVAQILVEVHQQNGAFGKVRILKELSKLGYWFCNQEINGRYHELVELLLVHESQFQRYEAYPLARYLDF
ncbi:unnamed protein product [Auanema sp. JU1783]|nr:unnamed protein product [Auanema sp. JU1783]